VGETTDEPDPTPVRPIVRPEPVSDVEKTDEPTTQPAEMTAEKSTEKAEADSNTDSTELEATSDPSPNCITRGTARTDAECGTQQLALTAQPANDSDGTEEAATTDAGTTEMLVEQAATPDSIAAESPLALASPPSSEPANAETAADQLSDLGLPESLLADVLTDALADEQPMAENEFGETVFAAGAFAVVFSKPLSRLTGAESSPLGATATPSPIPILYTRKKRNGTRNLPVRTKDKPDDVDDSDDDREPARGQEAGRAASRFDGRNLANVAEQYQSIEAAIDATLHSWSDSSDDSSQSTGIFHSAKSFAAGALAVATALLTLHGSRRSQRTRPQLRPPAPTYHGQTAVAAN
jgi:hypothetical protein